MEQDTSSIVKLIHSSDDSPLEHDELVSAWNALCEKAWSNTTSSANFSDIEEAALSTLTDNYSAKPSGQLGRKVERMLDSFPHATYMVSAEGQVIAFNSAAFEKYDLTNGDKIDHLPFDLPESKPLTSVVSNVIQSSDKRQQASLHRAYGRDNNHDVTLAISSSPGHITAALIFVISTRWQTSAIELLKRQFKLTASESEILALFIDGNSVKEISVIRNRSYATIRAQFQSVLTKTNSRSQTELLHIALSVSEFVTDIGVITDVMKHPHRRRAELLIEGGRIVEITVMGDLKGSPLLHVPSAVAYTFNPEFEHALFERGLYVISICPPGYGETDPVPTGIDRMQRFNLDVVATLNHLNIDRCPIIATNTSSPAAYELAARLPTRISHVFQIGACPPSKYSSMHGTESSWADSILNAGQKYPSVQKFLLKGGLKAWVALGSKRFMRLQLSKNKQDLETALTSDNAQELEHALKTATKYGVSALYEDTILAFGDWRKTIDTLTVNVTVIHGTTDTVFPIDSIRELVNDYPNTMKLIEIEDVGFTINFTKSAIITEEFFKFIHSDGNAVSVSKSESNSQETVTDH